MINKERNRDLIESVKLWPRRHGKGYLLSHLKGEPLIIFQAIEAKCYSCNVGDGGACTMTACPLLPFSQYKPVDKEKPRTRRKKVQC